MVFKFKTLALLPFIIGRVLAADLFFDLPITNATVAPDGFPRQAIQAGSFPGTNILASKGDVLHINVTMNQLDPAMRRSTSIHWHHQEIVSRRISADGHHDMMSG
ncbi:hypothetical protein B0H19DRAFT_1371159 [Mycena capillaripes]|nr:hypothetical protein B0H19DRAFT_1371159 [Mycena capillaripes]